MAAIKYTKQEETELLDTAEGTSVIFTRFREKKTCLRTSVLYVLVGILIVGLVIALIVEKAKTKCSEDQNEDYYDFEDVLYGHVYQGDKTPCNTVYDCEIKCEGEKDNCVSTISCKCVGSMWETASFGEFPRFAVPGGYDENNNTLYICRARMHDSLCIGTLAPAAGSCQIPYLGGSFAMTHYEVLVNEENHTLSWVHMSADEFPRNAVIGGHGDMNHHSYFIGRHIVAGTLRIGSFDPARSTLYVPYLGSEYIFHELDFLIFGDNAYTVNETLTL